MNATLYREQALRRLTKPDDHAAPVQVAPALSWLALAVCAGVLAAALAWGCWGTYRLTASGRGLLVRENGAFVQFNAPQAGWVEHVVPPGASVRAGDLIARVSLPEAKERAAGLQSRLQQIHRQREATLRRYNARLEVEEKTTALRRAALEESLRLTTRRVEELETLLRGREGLARSGNVTVELVMDARERLFSARETLSQTRAQMHAIEASLLTLKAQRDEEVEGLSREAASLQAEHDVAALSNTLAAEIRSRVDGEVVLVPVTPYTLVSPGQRLMTVETGGDGLQALLYVPSDLGKQIGVGMEVRLSPTTARREEFGALLGTVRAVSPMPLSLQEIADQVGNTDLARELAGSSAPVLAVVQLRKHDAPDGNGYAWSSRRGNEVVLDNGLLLTGDVTVRAAPPIELVIPTLRRWLGG